MSKYPEADKVSEHKKDMQVIGDFLTWFFSEGRTPCEWTDNKYYHGKTGEEITKEEAGALSSWDYHYEPGEYVPLHIDIEEWLANYFGIDRQRYAVEQTEMLEEIRARNE